MVDTDYEVEQTGNGFKIQFLIPISAPHTITYMTDFNYDELIGSNFRNKATIDWTGAEEPDDPVQSSNSFNPGAYTINNGMKTGEYNAANKRITWGIGFNYNLRPLTNAYAIDVLEKDQQFVDESLAVYPWKLGKGQNSANPDRTHPLTRGTDYEVEFSVDADSGETELKITLIGSHANTNAAYYIEFETSLDDRISEASYANKAELYSSDTLEDSDLRHTVHIPHGGKYVSKKGEQNGLLIDWEIRINEGQSSRIFWNISLLSMPGTMKLSAMRLNLSVMAPPAT